MEDVVSFKAPRGYVAFSISKGAMPRMQISIRLSLSRQGAQARSRDVLVEKVIYEHFEERQRPYIYTSSFALVRREKERKTLTQGLERKREREKVEGETSENITRIFQRVCAKLTQLRPGVNIASAEATLWNTFKFTSSFAFFIHFFFFARLNSDKLSCLIKKRNLLILSSFYRAAEGYFSRKFWKNFI